MDNLKKLIKISILKLAPTNESKGIMKEDEELWSKIRYLTSSINKNSDDYGEKYLKIKFNLDNELPLNKMIEICSMVIIARAVFHENKKYYPQVFLDECLYELYKNKMLYYDRIDLSEGIYVNKTSGSKECNNSHY